ncbi:glycosyltransferase [Pelagibius litoralis]|uniref:Glycosyltransferase n=1 Tax=Pelagibius litoralis TaxID=374515 RepID=A0A967EX51_9PROT|nr:glycosyltransferase [Pelagibius litoralis]NIA67730.1 glycosyltransferase [Pelagibius litoralis]
MPDNIELTDNAVKPVIEATIVVTPRERFGVAEESLLSIVGDTEEPYQLIYLDGASPAKTAAKVAAICAERGFRYLRYEDYLTPNQARNIGQRLVETDYVVFVDNDVIVSKGWLAALIACARETDADVVAPLTCQRLPLHSEIHQAGGEFAEDLKAFLKSKPEERRITDVHLRQGEQVRDVALQRGETQCCEFHCALVRKDAFARFGALDENLLATKEHIDFCMTVWTKGGRVMFEPTAVVTYLFPSRARPLTKEDWPYFALRWSPLWQQKSLDHFQRKWALFDDPYFEKRKGMLHFRHSEGIARPVLRRVPLLRSSYTAQKLGVALLTRLIDLWSAWLARRQPNTLPATAERG